MFGKSKTFLLDAAVQIAKNRTEANPDLKLGVVNARFDYELKAFTQGGFKHYHVRCSEETRIDRVGGSLSPKLSNDVTEQFAIQLNQTMVGKNVIWNDTKPMPPGAQFSTLQEVVDNETSRPTLSKTSSFHLQSTEKANQAKKSSLSVSLA